MTSAIKTSFKKIPIFSLFIFIFCCQNQEPKVVYEFEPATNTSIVIIGNTFAERLQNYNYFEPLLYKSFPDKQLTVRNLGWSGDEIDTRTRPLNFPTQDELLSEHKADVIIACYGMNESFRGPDSLETFKERLRDYLGHIRGQQYNGRSNPSVILISPIAHEKSGPLQPDGKDHNKNLKLYTKGMKEVAKALDIPFIDLFQPSEKGLLKGAAATINGIHLNETGYQAVSEIIARALNLPVSEWSQEYSSLKKLIDQKNQQFFFQYRAVNSEYIVGRRKEPWVQPKGGPITYPIEFAKLRKMITGLDSVLWNYSATGDPSSFELANRILNDTIQYEPLDKTKLKRPSPDQFVLPEGFEINLFASEVDFSLTNPVKITFDPQGRLWVTDMPSYPQYLPGAQPNDKILILEDTDGDGVADRETVFADSLYMPNSVEIGKGGVFVSQPPNIWFMKDTDGDGKADQKEIILHGFGTEDVHHTLAAYTWGPDGALYWHTGTFLHSQVETPHGLVRGDYGVTWRFEPQTLRLEPYASYPYANPWGHVFLRDGTEIISDVSTGMNYFAPPISVKIDYPVKHTVMRDFLTSLSKPKTCGTEIVSSRHFPDEMQGNVLFNTFVGTLGVKNHKIHSSGSGIIGEELAPLLQSLDPNFRPVDLQFGPDGALYIADWYNPIINHGERAVRDPLRDHTHGRIWRISYKNKPKLQPADLTKLSIPQLLDLLKEHEDRLRYRVRTQLRQFENDEVATAVDKWVASLDSSDPMYDQHRLEALWLYQQFHSPREKLLNDLLNSEKETVRTAATRVLFYWKDQFSDIEKRLVKLLEDPSMKVRLQAIVSLSHFKNENTVKALLNAAQLPGDYYTEYSLKEIFRNMRSVWWNLFNKDPKFLADEPAKADWLFGLFSDEKELLPPAFVTNDPGWRKYGWPVLTDADFGDLSATPAFSAFKERRAARLAQISEATTPEQRGFTLVKESDCFACHKETEKMVGPGYREIARKYGESDVSKLVKKIIEGGSGSWGDIPMSPHPGLNPKDAEDMVRYIFSLK